MGGRWQLTSRRSRIDAVLNALICDAVVGHISREHTPSRAERRTIEPAQSDQGAALDSTATAVFQKLHRKPNAFKRLIDLFKHRDKRKTGTISMRELHSGLEAVGVLESKLSDTVLYEIFSLCTMDFTGEIAYREFVVKVKAIKLPRAESSIFSSNNCEPQVFLVPRPVPKLKGLSVAK